MTGLETGKYPDGAVLVFDLLEAKRGEGAMTEGPRKVVGVMHKNAIAFPATAGWGFAGFKADTREDVVKDMRKDCFACHEARRAADYVYTTWRP
jgi:hypothetical protein